MILGLIPARGGSKGIPKKNIKLICGKPLIAWTIEAALQSQKLERIVVSTEDKEIADIAIGYGIEVLMRPQELAEDNIISLDVMKHAVENIKCSTLVLLQPTSPIRDKGLIDECINEFLIHSYDSLATGFMCDYKEYGKNNLPRQLTQGFFYDDGNVYVVKSEILHSGDRYGVHIGRKIISKEQNIDINDNFDFWIAECILRKRIGDLNAYNNNS